MTYNKISIHTASRIIELYALNGLSKSQIAKILGVSRTPVTTYIGYYEQAGVTKTTLLSLDEKTLIERVHPIGNYRYDYEKTERLMALFPGFHKRLYTMGVCMKELWAEYLQIEPSGYSLTRFHHKYHEWRRRNSIKRIRLFKLDIGHIGSEDLKLINKWRLSTDRKKWEKAVAILALYNGERITDISKKIERSRHAISRWVAVFKERGFGDFDLRRLSRNVDERKKQMEEKSANVIKLIHESPSLHNTNRTSWSLKTLSKAYKEQYCESISPSTISRYIRKKGFKFRQAKVVLTSPDPDYRKKLNNIKRILAGLKENEKFFSIDEYGPFAIRMRGGRSYTPKGLLKTVPQIQISKGSLICTAALELSKNQITHFYSDKKNTAEMIKLLMILLEKYNMEDKVYFSWDAASWHASKELGKKVVEVNEPEYRLCHNTPLVELAPLPSCAQSLNVIESVFSGMAKAIIHNSDYRSVDECKEAIDRYFAERNAYFIENPKRAGKKIWGKEVVKAVFTDSNTCKDPRYR